MTIRTRLIALLLPTVILAAVVCFGAVGYRMLEGWGWLDAVYMSVITLATVGFTEVHPLHDGGRVFTMLLVVIGLASVTYLVSSVGRVMFEEMLGTEFWRRRVRKQIDMLQGHVIVCGFGRVGRLVQREFQAAKTPYVVVERDEKLARELEERNELVLHGDATSEEMLRAAGIERARGLVTALPDDAANLYVVMTARDLNAQMPIVARAETEGAERRLTKAGATRVISPNSIGGRAMAQALLQPEVLDFLTLATARQDLTLQIEQVVVAERSPLAAENTHIAQMRERHRVFVVAMRKQADAQFDLPTSDLLIESGDTLIVVGQREHCVAINLLAANP
ncbi:MAG: potassium channel protein [Acidobacteriota bacterium]